MTWEKIHKQHSFLQEYRLTGNDSSLILKYNPLHRSARVTFQNNYRLFFLESVGSLSGKIIVKNEYGMETGSIVHHRLNNEGTVLIDSNRYRFRLENEKLTIFDKEMRFPIADCNIRFTKPNSTPSNPDIIDAACYAIGICWYLSLGLTKETLIAYANAS